MALEGSSQRWNTQRESFNNFLQRLLQRSNLLHTVNIDAAHLKPQYSSGQNSQKFTNISDFWRIQCFWTEMDEGVELAGAGCHECELRL